MTIPLSEWKHRDNQSLVHYCVVRLHHSKLSFYIILKNVNSTTNKEKGKEMDSID